MEGFLRRGLAEAKNKRTGLGGNTGIDLARKGETSVARALLAEGEKKEK